MTTTTHSEGPNLRWIRPVARRWPTAVALASAAFSALGGDNGDSSGLAKALPLLALLYLVVAAVNRRRATWVVFGVLIVSYIGLRALDVVDTTVVIMAIALAASIWGAGHGRHRERAFQVQLIGMVGFAAVALAGLAVDPELGRYLVAAGWLAHGIWDFVHLAKDKVVVRSYAEWCGVLDILIAAQLVVLPLL
jgi:hypothetical protein